MSEDGKSRGVVYPGDQQQSMYYGTFQGVANHPPPPVAYQPSVGLPQPTPPPHIVNIQYAHGYQTVPGTITLLINCLVFYYHIIGIVMLMNWICEVLILISTVNLIHYIWGLEVDLGPINFSNLCPNLVLFLLTVYWKFWQIISQNKHKIIDTI